MAAENWQQKQRELKRNLLLVSCVLTDLIGFIVSNIPQELQGRLFSLPKLQKDKSWNEKNDSDQTTTQSE